MKEINDLKAQIISEMDQYGLWQHESDNPILFTVQFYNVCKKLGILEVEDIEHLWNTIRDLWRHEDTEFGDFPIWGLLNRYPGKNHRKDQHDNYTAVASTVSIAPHFAFCADAIDAYGSKNFYSYNNVNPGKFSFSCLRQGFDIFFYKVCAGKSPLHWFGLNYLWFVGKIFFEFKGKGAKPENTSSHMLSWLRFLAIGDKRGLKWLKKYWIKKMEGKYGENWLAAIYQIYHGVGSPLTELVRRIEPRDYL